MARFIHISSTRILNLDSVHNVEYNRLNGGQILITTITGDILRYDHVDINKLDELLKANNIQTKVDDKIRVLFEHCAVQFLNVVKRASANG